MENTYTDFKVLTEGKEEVVHTVPEAPKAKRETTVALTAKQKLKAKAEALLKRKEEEAEKKRLAEIARKEKELAEDRKIKADFKELEDKENIILGKWLREFFLDNFSNDSLKKLKEKTKLLIEDGIK